jgi:single-strand DNA-binding protein
MSINRVIISGNLTRPAEIRNTQSGMPIAQFGVAVNERVKQGEQWVDRPNYFDCTMFGTRAEKIAQYLAKGSKVSIEGKLRYSQWEKDGEKRSKVEIIVDEIEFMSARQDQAPQYQPQQQYASQPAPQQQYQPQQYAAPQFVPVQGYAPQQGNAPQPQYVEATIYDQDIPF